MDTCRMKSWKRFSILFWMLLMGCGSSHSTDTPNQPVLDTKGYNTLSFDAVKAIVLEPYCMHCHSVAAGSAGHVAFDDYPGTFAHIKDIQDDVQTNDMPKGEAPVPPAYKAVLLSWIAAGAPQSSNLPIPGASSP